MGSLPSLEGAATHFIITFSPPSFQNLHYMSQRRENTHRKKKVPALAPVTSVLFRDDDHKGGERVYEVWSQMATGKGSRTWNRTEPMTFRLLVPTVLTCSHPLSALHVTGKTEVGIPSVFKINFLGLGALLVRSFAIVPRNLIRLGTVLASQAYSYSHQSDGRAPQRYLDSDFFPGVFL
jgi:hypothetical protein